VNTNTPISNNGKSQPGNPTPQEIVTRLIAAWNDHDARKVAALYAEDYEGADIGRKAPEHGRRAIIRAVLYDLMGFPDLKLELLDTITEGNRCVFVWRLNGTHLGRVMNIPPTGRKLNLLGTSILTITNGKISGCLRIWDMAGMLRSIGLLPDLQDEVDPNAKIESNLSW
jgi:steroid delta-isomerase-like uncharacterized protein